MEEIRYANASFVDSLKRLWHEAFGDPYGYINLFFENSFNPDRCLIISRGNEALSAVHFINAQINGIPVLYAYAVATLKAYRGHGFSRRLLDRAIKDFDCPIILRPAEDGLRRYYEKCGFSDAFVSQSKLITAEKFGNIRKGLRPIGAQEYYRLRCSFFEERGISYIKWDSDAVSYALTENEYCGGGALTDGAGVLLYRPEKNMIRIIESTISYNPTLERFGMIRYAHNGADFSGAYMNLVLE